MCVSPACLEGPLLLPFSLLNSSLSPEGQFDGDTSFITAFPRSFISSHCPDVKLGVGSHVLQRKVSLDEQGTDL